MLMARAIWNGVISFGLVSIPVRLVPAVREREALAMHLLHAKDRGRIQNRHVCEVDGKEVPWDQIVHGYEYEKGRYAVVTDEELAKLRPESTQAIEILEFVAAAEIGPMLFDKPYYLEPEKRGLHAYVLLREALVESGKVGIAKVVLRTREHLAALEPSGDALVLGLMHFAEEIVEAPHFDVPAGQAAKPAEKKAALMLVNAMTKPFDLHEHHDTYRNELRKLLEKRAHGAPLPKSKTPKATNVIDLATVLERSLAAQRGKNAAVKKKTRGGNVTRRAGSTGARS
jgi:DNA end-binding protein Ku